MPTKLYVGGLSWGTDEEELKGAFAAFGEVVEATVVREPDGRSRGFGFVSFAQDDDAERAKQELDGTELGGRRIRVDRARENRGGGGGGGGRGGGRPGGGGGGGGRGRPGGGGGGGGGGRNRW